MSISETWGLQHSGGTGMRFLQMGMGKRLLPSKGKSLDRDGLPADFLVHNFPKLPMLVPVVYVHFGKVSRFDNQ